jgi:hypothetical protein
MAMKFSQGIYAIKNPDKYIGLGNPRYRSSWELSVMRMCDENDSIEQWASESIKIPYRDPLTGKPTIYVPDFFVVFTDNKKNKRAELWEIKPMNQTMKENVGKNVYNQAQYVRNTVKWAAAKNWCKNQGITFRIITERDLFHSGKKMR